MIRMVAVIALACWWSPGVSGAADVEDQPWPAEQERQTGPGWRPMVTAVRVGTYLRLDFTPARKLQREAARARGSRQQPRFEIYQDERQIGGGTFEYG